jgi:hypothetical protein
VYQNDVRYCFFQVQFPYDGQPILLTGDTGRLIPEVQNGAGLTSPETATEWSSSNPSVAQVDATGLVTGLRPGYADISADGCFGFSVEVVARPATLEIEPDTVRMLPGNRALIQYVFRDAGGNLLDHWFLPTLVSAVSGNAAVVSVVPDPGYPSVEALAEGTATVRATLGQAGATVAVLVAAVTLGAPEAGTSHTCAISSDSLGYCWGSTLWFNANQDIPGRLWGPAPRPLPGSLRFTTLESGASHACGLTAGGALYCVGDNQLGQLGVEGYPTEPARVPIPVAVAAVSAGPSHTCALTVDVRVFCWGGNAAGELGSSTGDDCLYTFPVKGVPVSVSCSRAPLEAGSGLAFASVRAGPGLTCGRTTIGATYCWGLHYGQAPVLVDDTLGLDSLTLGGQFYPVTTSDTVALACALDPAGAAWCWGKSRYGLGDGSTTESWSPVPVAGGLTFRALSAGFGVCGVTVGGEIYCWGGLPGFAEGTTPVKVPGTLTFTSVAAGWAHGCGLATDGRVYCWGSNLASQLGVSGPDRASPVRVLGQR